MTTTPGTEPWVAPVTEADARTELAAAYRMISELGWTDLGATHLSLRVPDEPDAYLLIQWGLFFDEVTADNLVKVGFDGQVRSHDGDREVNPAAVTIHGGLLGARSDLHAVVHTHTRAGIAATCHPEGLLPLSQHALRFWARQGRHRYEGIALDDDEGPRLAADLGDNELLLLDNHGLLTVGSNMPEAFSAMYYAEFSAQVQVDVLAATQNPILVSEDECEVVAAQYEASSGYMYRDWMGLRRLLARRAQPSKLGQSFSPNERSTINQPLSEGSSTNTSSAMLLGSSGVIEE